MTSVGIVDLTEAVRRAVELAAEVDQPLVVVGALAMAAHGYQRQTSDVDIALPIVMSSEDGMELQQAAQELGLEVRAKHSFGGMDLRARGVRIDVLTLDRSIPSLIPAAVHEAVLSRRKTYLFGHEVYVVSLGYLIALKLVAGRKKDLADIVELIKTRIEADRWADDSYEVKKIVRQHLGDALAVDELAATARYELSQ